MKNRVHYVIILQFVFLSHCALMAGEIQNKEKDKEQKRTIEYTHFKKLSITFVFEFSYGRYAGSIGEYIPSKSSIAIIPKMEFFYERFYLGLGILDDFQTETNNIYYRGKSYQDEFYVNTGWDLQLEAGYNFWFRQKSVSTFTVGYRKLDYSISTIKTAHLSDPSYSVNPKYGNPLTEFSTKSITTGLSYYYLLYQDSKETISIMLKAKYNLSINIKYDNEKYHGNLHELTFGILFLFNDLSKSLIQNEK